MGYRAFFEGKRITVMGLGLLGRTVGDIEFMLAQGAKHVTVTDIRSAKILAPSVKRLKKYKKVHFVLGKHELKDFSARGGHAPDFILKAPSIPLASPYIREAEKSGIPMYMSTALFAQFARDKGAKIVGVTGTRGKSTVTHLLYHILKIAKRRVHLGGNIRGLSTLALLPKIKKGDLIVMELDSWQLQGFDALKISPSVSIFTSFSEDHLNYYPSMKRYFKDKAAIFSHQTKRDILIAGPTVANLLPRVASKIIRIHARNLPKKWERNILGVHNEENIACALAAAKALTVPLSAIRQGIKTFRGVEGRLEYIKDVRGMSIWNDNNATTPSATLAALRALRGKGRVVLIMGGADKKLPLRTLAKEARGADVVLLPGTGTNLFKKIYKGGFTQVYSLKDAVRQALRIAHEGDSVLFSPAFASFGLFKNEYDRNDQFMDIVRAL